MFHENMVILDQNVRSFSNFPFLVQCDKNYLSLLKYWPTIIKEYWNFLLPLKRWLPNHNIVNNILYLLMQLCSEYCYIFNSVLWSIQMSWRELQYGLKNFGPEPNYLFKELFPINTYVLCKIEVICIEYFNPGEAIPYERFWNIGISQLQLFEMIIRNLSLSLLKFGW